MPNETVSAANASGAGKPSSPVEHNLTHYKIVYAMQYIIAFNYYGVHVCVIKSNNFVVVVVNCICICSHRDISINNIVIAIDSIDNCTININHPISTLAAGTINFLLFDKQ